MSSLIHMYRLYASVLQIVINFLSASRYITATPPCPLIFVHGIHMECVAYPSMCGILHASCSHVSNKKRMSACGRTSVRPSPLCHGKPRQFQLVTCRSVSPWVPSCHFASSFFSFGSSGVFLFVRASYASRLAFC